MPECRLFIIQITIKIIFSRILDWLLAEIPNEVLASPLKLEFAYWNLIPLAFGIQIMNLIHIRLPISNIMGLLHVMPKRKPTKRR